MLFHPIFKLIFKKPELIVAHACGYAALARQEVSEATNQLVQKIVAWAVVAISLFFCLMLASIAVMLGAVNGTFHWALVAVPAVFLIAGLIALVWALRPLAYDRRFAELRAQVDADIDALRVAGRQQ